MLFTVVFGICMVIFTKINGCPTQRPCTTANGTLGSCIQSKYCPHFHKLNGGNLTPEELDFIKKSLCGMDLDKTKLFCCDNNGINPVGEAVDHRANPAINNAKVVVVEEVVSKYDYLSTTVPPRRQITTTVKPTTTAPEVIPCQTPNGEKAQCVSIFNCTLLMNYIYKLPANTTELQKRFLKESVCSYDANQSPVVCCGSDVNFNNLEENKYNFRENPSLPTDICGLQGSEIDKYMTSVPQIRQRLFAGNKKMNISIPNRIFGGENSELTDFPWTALLAYQTHDGSKVFACSGSLISSRYVLTAAHCVSGQNLESYTQLTGIRLGEWDYSKARDCVTVDGQQLCNEEAINVGIDLINSHPQYKPLSKEKYHDIALIRLDREVKFTKYIRPICLPTINDYVSPGERLTVSGWGLVDYTEEVTIKQKVEVPAIATSQCSVMFENSPRLTRVGKGQFCAGGEAGKDSCVGDSGAPLMRKIKSNTSDLGRWSVEGIVSFGTGCGLRNKYGVYTKVIEYLEWIHNSIV